MRLRRADGIEHEIEILPQSGSSVRARIDGREVEAEILRSGGFLAITVQGTHYRVLTGKRGDRIMAACGPASFEFTIVEESRKRGARGLLAPEIVAPMPGKVLRVAVIEGQRVGPGDPIVVLEAMKMETALAAESAAIVKKIRVSAGQMVDHGAVLVELAPVTPDS